MSTRQLLAAIDAGTVPAIKIGRTLRVPLWGLAPRPPDGDAGTA